MKSHGVLLIGAAAVLLLALPSHAETYKWVDKDGVVHFQDSPPAGGQSSTVMPEVPAGARPEDVPRVEGAADNAAPAAPKAPAARKQVKLRQNPKVEVYGTSWCPYCKMAKDFLRSRGIAFTEYDIEKDLDALRRKKEIDPDGGVPTTVIDGQVLRGFSAEAYEKALEAPN